MEFVNEMSFSLRLDPSQPTQHFLASHHYSPITTNKEKGTTQYLEFLQITAYILLQLQKQPFIFIFYLQTTSSYLKKILINHFNQSMKFNTHFHKRMKSYLDLN